VRPTFFLITCTTPTEIPAEPGPGWPGSFAWTFPAPLQEARIPIPAAIGVSKTNTLVLDLINLVPPSRSAVITAVEHGSGRGSDSGGSRVARHRRQSGKAAARHVRKEAPVPQANVETLGGVRDCAAIETPQSLDIRSGNSGWLGHPSTFDNTTPGLSTPYQPLGIFQQKRW